MTEMNTNNTMNNGTNETANFEALKKARNILLFQMNLLMGTKCGCEANLVEDLKESHDLIVKVMNNGTNETANFEALKKSRNILLFHMYRFMGTKYEANLAKDLKESHDLIVKVMNNLLDSK